MIEILAQLGALVAVNKPSGLLVHNSEFAGPREVTLQEQLSRQFDHVCFPLHRLDRGTSGVVLFSTERSAVSDWQERLQSTECNKTYLALVRGLDAGPQGIDHPVRDDKGVSRDARSEIVRVEHSAVERVSLVWIRLHTGRMHQARLHLKHLSHPVIGDANYGKGEWNRRFAAEYGLERLALHALEVTIPGSAEPAGASGPLRIRAGLGPDLTGPLKMCGFLWGD